jgi:hypothetical protein
MTPNNKIQSFVDSNNIGSDIDANSEFFCLHMSLS